MPETSPKLSNAARSVLTLAATRDDHLVRVPQLPMAAARQVIRSLLNAGLAEEIPAPIEATEFAWRTGDDGVALMLRSTATGLASIGETASMEALPLVSSDQEIDAASARVAPDRPESSEDTSPRDEPTTGAMPASAADALDTDRDEHASEDAISVDASIAPLVNAFIRELVKQERAPYVAAFLRRMERGIAERGTGASGTKRAREIEVSQRTIVELCSRPEGATGKELAEACGWPSIAARATCQKIADRFGYDLSETPRTKERGISFHLTPKTTVEA